MRIKNSVRVLHKVLRGIWGDCRVGKGGGGAAKCVLFSMLNDVSFSLRGVAEKMTQKTS